MLFGEITPSFNKNFSKEKGDFSNLPSQYGNSICLSGQYGFFLGNKYLHDSPGEEVSYATDTEDDEVTGRLAFEAHELHVGLGCVGEEHTRTLVDEERAYTAGHTADTDDGSDGGLGEHITYNRIDIRRP